MSKPPPISAHPLWERRPESSEWFDASDSLRKKTLMLGGASVIAALMCAYFAIRLVAVASEPPMVLGVRDNVLFSGKVGTFKGLDEEQISKLASDTLRHLLTRTEKGTLPELKPFLGEGVAEKVDADYEAGAKMMTDLSGKKTAVKDAGAPAPFLQEFVVTGALRSRGARAGFRAYAIRGMLTSRRLGSAQSSEVYLAVVMEQKDRTPENPSGWRLTRLAAADRGFYFQEEDKANRADVFGKNP